MWHRAHNWPRRLPLLMSCIILGTKYDRYGGGHLTLPHFSVSVHHTNCIGRVYRSYNCAAVLIVKHEIKAYRPCGTRQYLKAAGKVDIEKRVALFCSCQMTSSIAYLSCNRLQGLTNVLTNAEAGETRRSKGLRCVASAVITASSQPSYPEALELV